MKSRNTVLLTLLIASFTLASTGRKKFLNVTPLDNLSGNNYWKSEGDVEAYTAGIYSRFREATMTNKFFPAMGDMHGATVKPHVGRRHYITELRPNNLNTL